MHRTWNIATYTPLFETGKVVYGNDSTDLGQVLAGGSHLYAIPFESQIRVYKRSSGNNYRCLDSPDRIPRSSPMVWAHQGTCILGALKNRLVLWHVERREYRIFEIEGDSSQFLSYLGILNLE